MKTAVFWDVAPCNLVKSTDVSEMLGDVITRAVMEAGSTSETSVNYYQTTRSNIPEDSHLLTRRRENFVSRLNGVMSSVHLSALLPKQCNGFR
jgi:hypothetical protein